MLFLPLKMVLVDLCTLGQVVSVRVLTDYLVDLCDVEHGCDEEEKGDEKLSLEFVHKANIARRLGLLSNGLSYACLFMVDRP